MTIRHRALRLHQTKAAEALSPVLCVVNNSREYSGVRLHRSLSPHGARFVPMASLVAAF